MCLSIKINRPHHVLSEGKHLGFEWVTVSNGLGYRCGYVRLPAGHPWHGETDSEIACVHGGITFAEPDVPCEAAGDDDAWWLGFDCAHYGDAVDPDLVDADTGEWHGGSILGSGDGEIRSQSYVENQCLALCAQASCA
jgi:hypothetical protein